MNIKKISFPLLLLFVGSFTVFANTNTDSNPPLACPSLSEFKDITSADIVIDNPTPVEESSEDVFNNQTSEKHYWNSAYVQHINGRDWLYMVGNSNATTLQDALEDFNNYFNGNPTMNPEPFIETEGDKVALFCTYLDIPGNSESVRDDKIITALTIDGMSPSALLPPPPRG